MSTAYPFLDTCSATHHVQGIEVNDYPTCGSSETAVLMMYNDTSCTKSTAGLANDACQSYSLGKDIPAIMFAFGAASTYPKLTSFTWLSAIFSGTGIPASTNAGQDTGSGTITPATLSPTSSHDITANGNDSSSSNGNKSSGDI